MKLNVSLSKVSLVCGVILILLGGFVVFAWLTNHIAWIRIRPTLVPMSIPVAIGFLLNGLGLICLNTFRFQATYVLGFLILILSGIGFTESFLSINNFNSTWTFSPISPFRPMAPVTALGFSLSGLAFLAVTRNRGGIGSTMIPGIVGTMVFVLAAIALYVHLLDLSVMDGWGRIIRMAVHSPGGFVIIAVGFVVFAWQNEQVKILGSPEWLPVLVCVGVAILTFGLWIHLDSSGQSIAPTAVLIFGLTMATLLSLAVHFMQRERRLHDKIRDSHLGLEQEIIERKRVEEELRASQYALRNLSHRLQSIREDEKKKIAREVHDELGQVLTVLKMDLSCLEEQLIQDPKLFHDKMKGMTALVDQTVGTVQKICLELRPKILEVFGLCEAIDWQTKELQRHSGIQCHLTMDTENIVVNSENSLTCFRVLQEALTNVVRHADATEVWISLVQSNGSVELNIKDNGKGISEQQLANPQSLGLLGIRERVLHAGGVVTITGIDGTQLAISIPDS